MNTYEWVVATSGIVAAVATALLACFAFTTFQKSVEQLKLLSADSARQTRPYINIDLSPGLHGPGFWDITIENVGRSIARDVIIDAGQLLRRDNQDHISERLAVFLSHPLTLPPGANRRVMWRMEADDNRTEAGAGGDVDVTAKYSDVLGKPWKDVFKVVTEGYSEVAPAPTVGASVQGSGLNSEKSLANIEKALRALNIHVGMLRK